MSRGIAVIRVSWCVVETVCPAWYGSCKSGLVMGIKIQKTNSPET